jgi:hypothetical protein
VENQLSALAMALLTGWVKRPDLHSLRPRQEPATLKHRKLSGLQEKPQMMANLLGQAIQLVLKETDSQFVSEQAKQRLVLSLVAQAKAALRDLFLHSAKLQERQLHPEQDSPVPSGRARRCSQYPDPFAFFPGTPADQKCNRAARCGDYPILARYHSLRNRRGLAGCDNKCSRSQRKRAPRVQPFLIAAADKYRCLPRPPAD